jgi:hypothetical protein
MTDLNPPDQEARGVAGVYFVSHISVWYTPPSL